MLTYAYLGIPVQTVTNDYTLDLEATVHWNKKTTHELLGSDMVKAVRGRYMH